MKSVSILLFAVCMAVAVQQGVGRDVTVVDSSKGGDQEQFWGWRWLRPLPVIAPSHHALKCHAAVDGVYACLRKVMTPFWITRHDYTLHDCCSTLDNFKTQCQSLFLYTRETYIFPHSLLDQCSSAPPQPSHIPIPQPPHVRPVPPHVMPAPTPSSDDDNSDLVPTPSPAPSPSSDQDDSSEVPTPSPAPSPSFDVDSHDVPTPAPSPSSDDDFDEVPSPSPAPSPSSSSDEVPTPAPSPEED